MRLTTAKAGLAAAAIVAIGLAGPAAARIETSVVPRNAAPQEPQEEQDFEYGWVGLLGLAGLLGQRRVRRAMRKTSAPSA